MAGIILRPRAQLFRGHDWVYASEILKTFGSPIDGDTVAIKDGKDRLLGTGIYNSKSQISVRRISRKRQFLDPDFFRRRIQQAIHRRDQLGYPAHLRRVIWSDSDGLPGLIVDQYGSTLVLQTLTLAMDQRKNLISELLSQILPISGIIERNESAIRTAEGLPLIQGILYGHPDPEQTVECQGIRFHLNLLTGQKTGFYLDQAHNYHQLSSYATGKRVLDCFSNQGGFALACAQAGASEVLAIESSAENAERISTNAQLNTLTCIRVQQEDVFHFLRNAERTRETFDLIILDPPSFTKSKGRIHDAVRGYHELHRRAGALLNRGGLLASFSCSQAISRGIFLESLRSGLHDAQRSAYILREFIQSADHPKALHIPETDYLKGFLLEIT